MIFWAILYHSVKGKNPIFLDLKLEHNPIYIELFVLRRQILALMATAIQPSLHNTCVRNPNGQLFIEEMTGAEYIFDI